jgi:3-oxoacyl-[acyl-carrier-protein] synthase-3
LSIADQFIRAGSVKNVLVVGSETLTRLVDWTDRATCVLFGDGAGAVVLQADSQAGILSTHLHADGGKQDLLICPVGVSKGFEPSQPNAGVRIHMAGSDLSKADLDWLIPHQANLRIIEATAKRLDMSMDQVILTVHKTGNTSSGSVPLALDEAVRSGKIQRGQLLLLEAFGGGFTWGSALIRY